MKITNRKIQKSIILKCAVVVALMMACMVPAMAQITDGIYYIQNNNSVTHGYLWPSVTTYTGTGGYRYLTTSLDVSAPAVNNNNGVTYPAHDKSYSHWVVKNVDGGYIQLINPKLNQYVVIRTFPKANNTQTNAYGDRDVWLMDENAISNINYTYLKLNNDNSPYKISPKPGLNNVNNTEGYSLNSASGNDRVWLTWSKSDDNPRTGEGREGLIQFYSGGTPEWSFTPDLLEEPIISALDESTNTVTVTDNNGLPTGYNIRYTVSTNGNAPDDPDAESEIMTDGEYFVSETCIIKAVVERYGVVLTSVATSGTLVPNLPYVPTFTVTCGNKLELTCSNMPEAQIYYTMTEGDGTQDDPTNPTNGSFDYHDPLTLNPDTKVKAIAYYGMLHSHVSPVYTHRHTHTEAPTIALTNSTTITITGPEGSTIYYTTSGVDPVIDESGVDSPVEIPYTGDMMDVRALAKVETLEPSCVTRLLTVGTPTITITADDCAETSPRGNVVTIPLPGDGGSIWYAVTVGADSEAPDINAIPNPYTQYIVPVVIDNLDCSNEYYTVHAYAKSDDGAFFSSVASESRRMKTAGKPVLIEPSGSSSVVSVVNGVLNDKAIFTIDMGTPDDPTDDITAEVTIASDGTAEYAIPSNAMGTLAVAFQHGVWRPSCEATYTIPAPPATPTWSQECDNRLSLHTTSPMATIHYILDGEETDEVTLSSPTYTEGCLYSIASGTRVRAKAFQGFQSSGLLDYTYQPEHVEVPQFFVNGTTVTITGPTGSTVYYTQSVGTVSGVVPADPADPTSSSTAVTGNITIAGGNIITVFKAIAIPDDPDQASCVVRVVTREGYSINDADDLDNLSSHPNKYFFLFSDIDASSFSGTVNNFTGVLDGNYHTISNLNVPLFNTISGADEQNNAAVLNLMLKNVTISTDGNAGAIANTATGYTRIYNCGILPDAADGTTTSSISGANNVGGLVGELSGTARVINCFSYADITGGDYRGGIVGNNNVTTASQNVTDGVNTMIMNCMFYGDIASGGTVRAPIYGGLKISNSGANSIKGLNNYNYFRFNKNYVANNLITDYNCALGAQDRFLVRFEFFRNILNSNRELAMWYVSGSVADAANEMGHWVLDKSVAPYPILKEPGHAYPSIINPDAAHAIPIDPDNVHRNEGRKLGTLRVVINNSNTTTGGATAPSTINIAQNLDINITDKDFDNYNFNYYKIQLPYYNEIVGANGATNNNYTGNKVVTGWKITGFTGGTEGSFTTGTDVDFDGQGNIVRTPYNFVDRACTNKDLYDGEGTAGSDRVFNQGAYYEVPDGVTAITIEPYWANCVYLSDANYDVTYDGSTPKPVTIMDDRPTESFNNDNTQTVYTSLSSAHEALSSNESATVYDYAIVLVGNYHEHFGGTPSGTTVFLTNGSEPFTIMSADLDGDNEPDNTFFYQHTGRKKIAPVRFDFLNVADLGLAQKEDGAESNFQVGIFYPKGWFEITNTVLIHFGQFEYADGTNKTIDAPLILQGGIYEQFVSARNQNAVKTQYLLIGGNVWFKNFANGCHTGGDYNTPKVPISISGGDYENFYLSGIYRPEWAGNTDNAECYIDGGRFGEVAGAGMQVIKGNVTWLINAADIKSFFGGGINNAEGKSIEGNITTLIRNSYVDEFCGGPKFGNMKPDKTVKTIATDCHFGNYFGAGYGGTAINRVGVEDNTMNVLNYTGWNGPTGWVKTYYSRSYQSTQATNIPQGTSGSQPVDAISTSYEYEYMFFSGGADKRKVARFYINFATLSLASTNDVTSTLTGCTIGNFYGGGKFGYVNGDAVSTLTDCIVTGDAFGSGFSAAKPTCDVMPLEDFIEMPSYDNNAGVFNDEQVEDHGYPETETYTWKEVDAVGTGYDDVGHYILTTEDLDNLGAVSGNATLTIDGHSRVSGDVYGGGALASSNTGASVDSIGVNINGGTFDGDIYGGGMGNDDNAVTVDRVVVNIGNSGQDANNVVITSGSVYGCNNVNGSPQDDVTVNIYKTKHVGTNSVDYEPGPGDEPATYAIANVFGGGNRADYTPSGKTARVNIFGCDNTIRRTFGGGNAAATPSVSTDIQGGRFYQVFGGGNGEVQAANINGDVSLAIHGGNVGQSFGGSNTLGNITGNLSIVVDNEGPCGENNLVVDEFFCGGNFVNITGDLQTEIRCGEGMEFHSIYGGCNQADISGNVVLNLCGGTYTNVFGGSKGFIDPEHPEYNKPANIDGNVTLNLYGGTMENVFGGSNINGNITGIITVNVLDEESTTCPLYITNIYGGSNMTNYIPTYTPVAPATERITPVINVIHAKYGVTGNVYGGSKGVEGTTVIMKANPLVNIGYDSSTMSDFVPSGYTVPDAPRVSIGGSVFGGGDAAEVHGNTEIRLQNRSKVLGNVYGGGNRGEVKDNETTEVNEGNTKVIVNSQNQ